MEVCGAGMDRSVHVRDGRLRTGISAGAARGGSADGERKRLQNHSLTCCPFTPPLPLPDMPFESIKWYREAELQHGRVAQLAWLGFVFPNIYHFPSDATHNFGELNALAAVRAVPQWGLVQLAVFVGALEAQRYAKCIKGDNAAGDVGLGQGGFNPFGFEYTQEEYEEKQLQEIKHCRLAMLGVLGVWWQGILSGQGVIQQIGGAFDAPDYYGKAGYYFPDGI
mmetsp:Transcript_109890/g.319792  ORF Transcript_109890/g.319792 Transcript_109890/m.319792 type:complete len:223 (-) Transcript_109890:376-1044(-)